MHTSLCVGFFLFQTNQRGRWNNKQDDGRVPFWGVGANRPQKSECGNVSCRRSDSIFLFVGQSFSPKYDVREHFNIAATLSTISRDFEQLAHVYNTNVKYVQVYKYV